MVAASVASATEPSTVPGSSESSLAPGRSSGSGAGAAGMEGTSPRPGSASEREAEPATQFLSPAVTTNSDPVTDTTSSSPS